MGQWAVAISAERYEAERLFRHATLELTGASGERVGPEPGDDVLVVVEGEPPIAVASGRVSGPERTPDPDDPDDPDDEAGDGPLVIVYRRRSFDDPPTLDGIALTGPVTPLDRAAFEAVAGRLQPPRDDSTWLVSLDLPIEAPTAAEAARQFWSYVMDLGPRELPVFVSPKDDELAMTAYVLGAETNLDPEEDEGQD